MRKQLGSLSLMVVSASLLLAASAWSRPAHNVAREATATHTKASRWTPWWIPGHRTDVTGYVWAWRNVGSCHSYPDEYEVYVVTGDPETGEIDEWADVGEEFGTDCGGTAMPGLDETAWDDCGCDLWDCHIQGDPEGTTTWTPDQPFSFDGGGREEQARGDLAVATKDIGSGMIIGQAHRNVLPEPSAWWKSSIH